MKLLLDTSVWVEHLRHDVLDGLIEPLRGRFALCMDAVVAAERRMPCRDCAHGAARLLARRRRYWTL